MIIKKMGSIGKKVCKGIWKGIEDNKEEIFTLSLVVIPALLIQDTSFASVTKDINSGIDAFDKPVGKLFEVVTGPIPAAASTIAIALGGMSWASGQEQQITKFLSRSAVGGGVAVAAPNVYTAFLGVVSSTNSCLY